MCLTLTASVSPSYSIRLTDVKYRGAAAVGNSVFFAPTNEDNVGVLDTTTSTFSTIDTAAAGVTDVLKYNGAAAVGTSVFMAPYNQDNVGVLDTTTAAPLYLPAPETPVVAMVEKVSVVVSSTPTLSW